MKFFYLTTLAVALCTMEALGEVFKPTPCANPWQDDYSHFASFAHSDSWGPYNVHDPACRLVGDTYYLYSTDAIYWTRPAPEAAPTEKPKMGFLQMRKSTDLVNWDFLGWAFDSIPQEPVEWVKNLNDGHGATNIWAPYMVPAPNGDGYRLYYCVSAFGKKTSMIALATAPHPEGPWQHVGCVVRTDHESPMNAIDPTVTDVIDGKQWMTYGSFFGGIYCVELNPATGFTAKEGDLGHVVARRANYRKDNLEAPEMLHANDQYYLFGSYDPLMTTYNVRVGRSDSPTGPFYDFFGKEMADTTDNYPILTAPYRFEGHDGWAGTAHCGVIKDANGNCYMCHQGRLAPNYQMMDLHVRQIFFTPDGWPVVSPERYTGTEPRKFRNEDLAGEWEIIRVQEPKAQRSLEAGQILWGEGDLLHGERNDSKIYTLLSDGKIAQHDASWALDEEKQLLNFNFNNEMLNNLIIFAGHDWEREQDTVLFTGLDSRGRSVWGKRVK